MADNAYEGETSANSDRDQSSQPISARNMQQLLQSSFGMQSQPSSADAQSILASMNEQDAEWLSNAMSGLFSDPSKEMRARMFYMKKLLESSPLPEDTVEVIEELSDQLEEFIENLDLAIDFANAEGLDLVKICLDRDESRLRVLGCRLANELVQNSEYGMACILHHPSVFEKLISLVKCEQEMGDVRRFAFSTIAAVTRESEDARSIFLSSNPSQILIMALKSDIVKLQTSAAFYLQSTRTWTTHEWHHALLNQSIIPCLCEVYRNSSRKVGYVHEMTLSSILMFSEIDLEKVLFQLKEIDFKQTLMNSQTFLESQEDPDGFQEEVGYVGQLLKLLI